MENDYIEWRLHSELIHYTQPLWMRELATPRHTEHKNNVEIECLQPSECSKSIFYLCQGLYL